MSLEQLLAMPPLPIPQAKAGERDAEQSQLGARHKMARGDEVGGLESKLSRLCLESNDGGGRAEGREQEARSGKAEGRHEALRESGDARAEALAKRQQMLAAVELKDKQLRDQQQLKDKQAFRDDKGAQRGQSVQAGVAPCAGVGARGGGGGGGQACAPPRDPCFVAQQQQQQQPPPPPPPPPHKAQEHSLDKQEYKAQAQILQQWPAPLSGYAGGHLSEWAPLDFCNIWTFVPEPPGAHAGAVATGRGYWWNRYSNETTLVGAPKPTTYYARPDLMQRPDAAFASAAAPQPHVAYAHAQQPHGSMAAGGHGDYRNSGEYLGYHGYDGNRYNKGYYPEAPGAQGAQGNAQTWAQQPRDMSRPIPPAAHLLPNRQAPQPTPPYPAPNRPAPPPPYTRQDAPMPRHAPPASSHACEVPAACCWSAQGTSVPTSRGAGDSGVGKDAAEDAAAAAGAGARGLGSAGRRAYAEDGSTLPEVSYVPMCACVCVCARVRVRVCACASSQVLLCMCAHMRSISSCVCVCVRARVRVCVRACKCRDGYRNGRKSGAWSISCIWSVEKPSGSSPTLRRER
jgi:hypothetical protein